MIKKRGILLCCAVVAMLLPSCKKLNSSTLFLSTFCNNCQGFVESSILEMEGVHYVKMDTVKNSLTFHYENANSLVNVERWLNNSGFMGIDSLAVQDSTRVLRAQQCCESD